MGAAHSRGQVPSVVNPVAAALRQGPTGSMGWQLSLSLTAPQKLCPGDDTPVRAIGHRSSACMQAGRLCGPGQYHMAGIYQSNRKHLCSG